VNSNVVISSSGGSATSCRQGGRLLKGLEAVPGKGSGNGERASSSAKDDVEVLSYLLLSAQLRTDLTQALPSDAQECHRQGTPLITYYLSEIRRAVRTYQSTLVPGPFLGALMTKHTFTRYSAVRHLWLCLSVRRGKRTRERDTICFPCISETGVRAMNRRSLVPSSCPFAVAGARRRSAA